CRNNLRQWGVATFLFTMDNDGYLPKDGAPNGTWTDRGWYIDLPQMMGMPVYSELAWRTNAAMNPGTTPWICPANRRRSNGYNLFHYCLNRYVNGTGKQSAQRKLSELSDPGHTIWLFDNGKAAAVAGENNVHTNLHRQGAHFLFVEGNV